MSLPTSLQVWIDGRYYDKENARISVWDHGLLYGDGIFEGIRAYNGRVFRLDEHLERLYRSARCLGIQIPMPLPEMADRVVDCVRRNQLRDAYIRLLVTRGSGDLGLDPRKCRQASVVVIADRISLYPSEAYEAGLRLVVASTRKNAVDALNPRIKSMNYLNNILAKMEAIQAGVAESVMLDRNGFVTECTSENIFTVKDRVLYTPIAAVGILEGITRGVVMELARTRGYRVEEAFMTTHDLMAADECFVTGTGAEILPVVEVGGRAIGEGRPGPVTSELLTAYRDLTQREGTPIDA